MKFIASLAFCAASAYAVGLNQYATDDCPCNKPKFGKDLLLPGKYYKEEILTQRPGSYITEECYPQPGAPYIVEECYQQPGSAYIVEEVAMPILPGLPDLAVPICDTCEQLDCYCTLPQKPLGSSVTTSYTSGSDVTTNVQNTEVPDVLHIQDCVACTDSCTAGNGSASENEVGTRTFQISGSVSVAERYEQNSANCSSARQRTNACSHKECRRELVPNTPAPGGIPCACIPQ